MSVVRKGMVGGVEFSCLCFLFLRFIPCPFIFLLEVPGLACFSIYLITRLPISISGRFLSPPCIAALYL